MLDELEKPGLSSSSGQEDLVSIDIGAQLQQEMEDVVNQIGNFNQMDDS